MSEGFLGRWSRRKLDVQEGKPVADEPASAVAPAALASPAAQPEPAADPLPAAAVAAPAANEPAAQEIPPPTLEDVKALTSESDFSRFAASDVAPEVKNAAMKKLFSDPRYNVMDRLDVYIDDYSQPDPIPESMLRQLVSAKFLGLLDGQPKDEQAQDEAAAPASGHPREAADNPDAQIVAQSVAATAKALEPPPDHAHPDLRLQPDHAPPGEDPGPGAG